MSGREATAAGDHAAVAEHFCGVCFQPSTAHTEGRCECGDRECRTFPPLCCPGCPCESWEEAHVDA